ncbi:MAG: hypothetical protein AAGA87_04705 [Pseudomonadota bacterium]
MILVTAIAAVALCIGSFIPLRFALSGFIAAAVLLFVLQAGISAASGYAGSSLEESLLLFNGSITSYLGFNLQITYRSFVVPLLALSLPLIFRLTRSLRGD